MSDRKPDPAGWNRIDELQTKLNRIEALSQEWKFHRGTDAIAFADELTAALRVDNG